jgi:hypothetical protein
MSELTLTPKASANTPGTGKVNLYANTDGKLHQKNDAGTDVAILRAGDEVIDATKLAVTLTAATSKTTPVDADLIPVIDSAASNVLKKLTWANLKATAKTYFDTLYLGIAATAANASQLLGKTWAAPDPIGSGTPNSVAATTLSATGQVTTTLSVGSSNNGTTNYAAYINTGTPSTANLIRLSGAVTSDVYFGRAASADTIIMGMVGSAPVVSVTSAGAAITGTLSASGLFTSTSGGVYLNGSNSDTAATGNYVRYSTNITQQSNAANTALLTKVFNGSTFVDVATISSTGLAVTGNISATGAITSGGNVSMTATNPAVLFNTSAFQVYKQSNDIRIYTESVDRAIFNASGIAVTGAVSATTTMNTGGYTVATLPAGSVGDRAYVTDATAPTFLGALTGGGAVRTPVFKNASAWVAA